MISDIVFEALQEIERYKDDFPEVYKRARSVLRELLTELDTPPGMEPQKPHESQG